MRDEITKMLDAKIISQGKPGTWVSPAFIIKQKTGYRMVVDYKILNSVTVPFYYPLPRIDDIFDKLATSNIYTHLDLRKGYFQIALDEETKHKCGFVAPFGIYEFNRLPFGLKPSFPK
jgi:hypothetical protein